MQIADDVSSSYYISYQRSNNIRYGVEYRANESSEPVKASTVYTAEEMHQKQMEMIAANTAGLSRLTNGDAYEDSYRKIHPEYNGEKICCEYPGGTLYTVKEIAQIMWNNLYKK